MAVLIRPVLKQKNQVRNFYSDLNVSAFINRGNRDVIVNKDIESVKESMFNLLMTMPGERLFDSTIGSGLKNLLFENITPQTTIAIRETIKSAISNFEPRAQIVDVVVSPLPDENAYAISIVFSVININEPITLELLLNRIR